MSKSLHYSASIGIQYGDIRTTSNFSSIMVFLSWCPRRGPNFDILNQNFFRVILGHFYMKITRAAQNSKFDAYWDTIMVSQKACLSDLSELLQKFDLIVGILTNKRLCCRNFW